MSTRQKLMDQYEDALFSVIMNEIMIEEGKELREENARLKADPRFSVPEETNQRCLKAISHAFGKRKHARAARTVWHVFQRVSVAVFAAVLLFTGVYAAFPPVRDAALNLLVEVSGEATHLHFGEDDVQGDAAVETAEGGIYEFSELPDGFVLTDSGGDRQAYWRTYTSESGATVELEVMTNSYDKIHRFDTESMENAENIEVNGNSGILAVKDGWIHAILTDEKHQIFIDITCHELSREELLNILFGLAYKE